MRVINIVFLVLLLTAGSLCAQTKFSSGTFGNLEARQIGPAVMSGRITAIDAVNTDPKTVYIGTASGGIWKSISGGTIFKPIFDKYCQSIGALAIDQKNPKIVWAGTGESNMRNSVSVGNGIYKSDDAGDSWKISGLENTEHISKVIINPDDGSIVYAAAPGPLWRDSPDRGLYKTTDGGVTWNNILYIDEMTGCADVVIDLKNPEIVYASMWTFRRTPYSFSSGGKGSGLYKSIDGGKSWNRIDKAFTDGELGRIAIAISPSNPDKVYAIAESKKTALFRSTDGGETWIKKSTTANVTARPFYFSTLVVDPSDTNRVYRPAFSLSISRDGGESFAEISNEGGWVHSDHHALWINPKNPEQLYLGTDGGVYMSLNSGYGWVFLANIPVSQYYHIATDNQNPYNIYGGLQDNGSWAGPSSGPGGIRNKDWQNVGGGDGFAVIPDPLDNNIVYSESQGGYIQRLDKRTGTTKDIQIKESPGEPKYRYNWNTPIIASPTNGNVIYTGAQFLFRTTNRGDSFEKISPDLTTNDPGKQKQEETGGLTIDNSSAENHCTIYTIAESYIDPDILWVGTDDGNVQLSKDGGKNWQNVTGNIPGLPKNTWCSCIEPGRFTPGSAFATFDGHRSGDKKPYVYKTSDFGKTWSYIGSDDIKSYVHVIRQDLINKNLLFLGSEFGLYVSIDGGISWTQFTNNVPNVPVMDMLVHKLTNDLVLGTHGRGVIIIDDISPLRGLNDKILNSDFSFLDTREHFIGGNNTFSFYGFPVNAGEYLGTSANGDYPFVYYLKDRVDEDFKAEILDKNGKNITNVSASKRKGLNITRWNMTLKPPKVAPGANAEYSGFIGPLAPEGEYIFRITRGKIVKDKKFTLKNNPASPYSSEDRKLQSESVMILFGMQEELTGIIGKVKNQIDSLDNIIKTVNEENKKNDVTQMREKYDDFYKSLLATKEGGITGEEKLREKIGGLYISVNSYLGRPTNSQLQGIKKLKKELSDAKKKADNMLKK